MRRRPKSLSLPVVSDKPPRVRPSRMSRWRAYSLMAVHVLIIGHILHWYLSGRTLSPVEPSESMDTLRTGAVNAGFILLGIGLLATFVLGRFLCGWGCHFIAYQDLALWVMKRLKLRPRAFRSRYLIYVPLGAAFYMFGLPLLDHVITRRPPPLSNHLMTTGFWDTFPGLVVGALTILIGGCSIVYFLGPKAFCTYACPYGAMFAVADRFAKGRIRVTDACSQCGHCTAVCTSNVRVAEEVKLYKMVVDPGCMKCMDCVTVCPNDALYFGFGPTAIGVKSAAPLMTVAPSAKAECTAPPANAEHAAPPAKGGLGGVFGNGGRAARPPQPTKTDAPRPARYDLSRPEELAALVIFAAVLLAYRGLYGKIPFLFSLALAAIATYVFIQAAALFHRRDVLIQRTRLKIAGRIRPLGYAYLAGAAVLLLLTVHSAAWRYLDYRGHQEFLMSPPESFGWQYHYSPSADPTSDSRIEAAGRSRAYLKLCEDWGFMTDPSNLRELVWASIHADAHDDAEKHAAQLAEMQPDEPGAWLNLAQVQTLRDKLEAARTSYRRAIAVVDALGNQPRGKNRQTLQHTAAAVYREWGLFLLTQGDQAAAQAALDRSLPFELESPLTLLVYGELRVQQQRTDEARRFLIRAVQADPTQPQAVRSLSQLGKMPQDYSEAAEEYGAALSTTPDPVVFLANRGFALAQLGRMPESLRDYRAAVSQQPNAWDVRADLGAILLASGDIQGAIAEYEAILKVNPNHAEAALRLGFLWETAGDANQAARHYEIASRHGDAAIRQEAEAARGRLQVKEHVARRQR